ncbi:MAG: excinuclease ABC subunit UvrC [Christensenellales bacterium]|nr:excinuclease ABC subunit UvrC [Christensenellales bacterium]
MNSELLWKIANLPDSPGCYLMKSAGEIIYVGKAKNLKNRVTQYFHASRSHTPKVLAMVEKIDDFDIMLVQGELEAFTLECNLIKLHMPRYNILLKDDKQYPYLRVDLREDFPRIALARRQERDGARYFGPYRGATVVREVMDVLNMIYPLRTCAYVLNPEKPLRPCVHHQIGRCMAPCAGKVTREAYRQVLDQALEFLNGKYKPVLDTLKSRMESCSREMNFESAAVYRDRIRAVESLVEKQTAISTVSADQDVIAVLRHDADALTQILFIRSGRMIGSERFTLEGAGDESPGEILTQFMLQYYGPENMPPREILLSATAPEKNIIEQLLSEQAGSRVYLQTPQRGDKFRLVNTAMKNLRDQAEKLDKKLSASHARTIGALEELAAVLGLDKRPRRIEGYDISNTQGALSVASQVVMIDGVCAAREYRHYRIKSVQGANDFASMHEVITRRLSHGLDELAQRQAEGLDPQGGKFSDLPDLILIDGGPGQLSYARNAMQALGLEIPMFGLAERIDEIVLPDSDTRIVLDRHSNALHLIQRLRDEAHRFAVTHHRKLRGKQSVSSRLDGVPGVGPARRKAVLKHFKTAEALRSATAEEIAEGAGIPSAVAAEIYKMLHEQTT